MNMRTILSGVTAILLVGVFYTFSFCFVEEVDEAAISVDYYYATEPEDEPIAEEISDEDKVVPSVEIKAKLEDYMPDILDNEITADDTEPVVDAATVTEVPAAVNIYANAQPASDASNDNNDDDLDTYEDEEDYQLYEDDNDGVFEAEDNEVYAEDQPVDEKVASRLDEDQVDSAVVTTITDFTVADVPSVPVADVVITISNQVNDNTFAVSPMSSKSIYSGETLYAKYNGAVHTVDAYELVCMIVNNEISSSFSEECIKAQAVAAYSYVKYHNVNNLTPSVLVKANPPQKIKDLVAEVFGITCYYNGKVAQTVYMASSSGYTSSSANVWGGDFGYLRSVECPFDSSNDPNYGKAAVYSESEVRTALQNALGIKLSDNPSNWLKVTGYVDGNYVSSINVDDQTTISGKKMRESVMSYKLRSAAFDVSYSDGNFTFVTYGYGHGVGMSQNGANYLGKQGYSYVEILKYYFTGIEVY